MFQPTITLATNRHLHVFGSKLSLNYHISATSKITSNWMYILVRHHVKVDVRLVLSSHFHRSTMTVIKLITVLVPSPNYLSDAPMFYILT